MSAQDEGGRGPPKPKGKVRGGMRGGEPCQGLGAPQNLGKVTFTVLGPGGASQVGWEGSESHGTHFHPVPSWRVG